VKGLRSGSSADAERPTAEEGTALPDKGHAVALMPRLGGGAGHLVFWFWSSDEDQRQLGGTGR